MYVWIWRRLPGNWLTKSLGCLVLFAGTCALLFYFLFPWAEKRLPWNDITVDPAPSHAAPASSGP